MKIEIGTCPCSWGVWYADGLPSGVKWDVYLDQAAKAGYKALELGPLGFIPGDAKKIDEEVKKRGMYICSGTGCYPLETYNNVDALITDSKELLDTVRNLGAEYLVFMDSSNVGRLGKNKNNWDNKKFTDIYELVKNYNNYVKNEYGLKIVFHPHVKTTVEYEKEIIELMECSEVDLCFDTGHHAYANGSTEMGDMSAINFIKKYADKIKYLHFKNVDPFIIKKVKQENLDADEAFDLDVMCDLKNGIIDFVTLKNTLEEINFNGIGIIEQDMPNVPPDIAYEAAKRNLEYLKEINMI